MALHITAAAATLLTQQAKAALVAHAPSSPLFAPVVDRDGFGWLVHDGFRDLNAPFVAIASAAAILVPKARATNTLRFDDRGNAADVDGWARVFAVQDGKLVTVGRVDAFRAIVAAAIVDGRFDADNCMMLFRHLTGHTVLRRRVDSPLPDALLFGFEPPNERDGKLRFCAEQNWDLVVVTIDLATTTVQIEVRKSDGEAWQAANREAGSEVEMGTFARLQIVELRQNHGNAVLAASLTSGTTPIYPPLVTIGRLPRHTIVVTSIAFRTLCELRFAPTRRWMISSTGVNMPNLNGAPLTPGASVALTDGDVFGIAGEAVFRFLR